MRDLYPYPLAFTTGPMGRLLVIDHDPQKKLSKLLLLHLHNPVDVEFVVVCFSDGVA